MARNVSTVPILNLPVAVTLDGSEWVPVVQGTNSDAVTRRAQAGSIANFPTQGAQDANTFLGGPTSGSAAAPAFRLLTYADLTSAGVTVTSGKLLSVSNTITLAGLDAISVDFGAGNAGTGNTFYGQSAGNLTLTGTGNTALGYHAGTSLTVPAASANPQANVFIGYEAGASATTCRESTCIGYQAGYSYTGNGAGVEDGINTAIGSLALKQNASGQHNVAIGQKALLNSTGSKNTGIGTHAGVSLASGDYNTFIGETSGDDGVGGTFAGSYNTFVGQNTCAGSGDKSFNTGVGVWAGQALTTGAGNNLFGYSSGKALTSAVRNCFFGFETAPFLTTGTDNCLFGYQAGYGLTTIRAANTIIGSSAATGLVSDFNVVVGYQAAGSAAISGDGNVLLGASTTLNSTGLTNCIVIGYQAIGLASNTAYIGGASTTAVVLAGSTTVAANLTIGQTGTFKWNARSQMTSPADGNVLMYDSGGSTFGLLQFGGVSASFPAFKRNGTGLDVRLADDSNYAPLAASRVGAGGAPSSTTFVNLAAGTTGASPLRFIQGAAPSAPVDGDVWREDNTNTGLKIRVNGVTKTITLS